MGCTKKIILIGFVMSCFGIGCAPDGDSFSTNQPLSATSQPVGITLSAWFSEDRVKAGSPVELTIAIRNDNDRTLDLAEVNPFIDFAFVVQGPSSERVSYTRYGQKMHNFYQYVQSPRKVLVIPAHQEAVYQVPLNVVYDMTMVGVYTLSVGRRFVDPQTGNVRELQSETASVVVMPFGGTTASINAPATPDPKRTE